jgi:signal transduction histidine kinase
MSGERDLFCVHLPDFLRTATFRWIILTSGAVAICILLMFGFVYWQSSAYLISGVDQLITDRVDALAMLPPPRRLAAIKENLDEDPRRLKVAGLFDAQGHLISGNVESLPHGLRPDAPPQELSVMRFGAFGREHQTVRIVVRRLADGETLLVGRAIAEVMQVRNAVERAVTWGFIPALCLSLFAGVFLSIRLQRRIGQVNQSVQRIVAGELRERLPNRGTRDPFDELATLINGMLDEIETLIRSIAGVGDDIAHDLRTPLTRVRVTLERARQHAASVDQLRTAVDQAIVGLDQSLAMITALLRISEIEHGRRLAGFGDVALAELVREVADLYEPIAEDKRVRLSVEAKGDIHARGDRDLLFEAIANLVDNAVKFTPQGGHVELVLSRTGDQGLIQVRDSGPGIAAAELEFVTRRFFRSDKSRANPGLGLGLSLVNAIAKLHGFRFTISPGAGCVAEIAFSPESAKAG